MTPKYNKLMGNSSKKLFNIEDPDVQNQLIILYDEIGERIFEGIDAYHNAIRRTGEIHVYGGLDPESTISKDHFLHAVESVAAEEDYKLMYYYDISALIGSLQTLLIECDLLVNEFLKLLSESDFLLRTPETGQSKVIYATGSITLTLLSCLNRMIISFVSILDITSKLAKEVVAPQSEFSSYKRLQSKGVVYNPSKDIFLDDCSDTLLESYPDMRLMTTFRNDIVHNSSMQSVFKVYNRIENGVVTEKFVLMPDHTDGYIHTVKSRNRFYSNEVKLNEEITRIKEEFYERATTTIVRLRQHIATKSE